MFDTIEIKEVKQRIGALIRNIRKQQGFSQSKLAESLDVSRTTIQNLELGRNFTIDTLLKALKALDKLEKFNDDVIQLEAKERYDPKSD